MTETTPQYYEDSQGNLVKTENIREVDLLRHELVTEIILKGTAVALQVAAFKQECFEEVEAFAALSLEKYGVKRGGSKGNITLTTFDGKYKVELARQQQITFTEQLAAAQELILQCFGEWTEGSCDEVRLLISEAFKTNRAGQVSVSKILGLLRLEIKHPKWDLAMQAIRDAIQVFGTASYIRLHRRVGSSNKYQQISLDGSTPVEIELRSAVEGAA